jgi:hypothetical protein
MRFQAGVKWPFRAVQRRPRGRGRGTYRLSRGAYAQRVRALVGWRRSRNHEETERLKFEIALATHPREPIKALARRLGLQSRAYCRRIARRYRAGLMPMLPTSEAELMAFRDSLYGEQLAGSEGEGAAPTNAGTRVVRGGAEAEDSHLAHARGCRCPGCQAGEAIAAAIALARRPKGGGPSK